MSQPTEVTQFATASVAIDQAKRAVYIAADEYRTSAREWRSVLRYLAKRLGSVSLSDEFECIPGTTQFVAVGTF